jgi:predicted PurR-regulated permease PerM
MAIWVATGLVLATIGVVLVAGRAAKAAIAIVLLSLFFAYVVAPFARQLRRIAVRRRRRLSPVAALVLVYFVLGAGLLGARLAIGGRLLAEVDRFTAAVPTHVDEALRLTGSLARWQEWFGWSRVSTTTLGAFALGLSDWVRVHVADAIRDALDYRWAIPWLGVVPALSFVFLTQFPSFRRSALRILPRGHLRWRGSEFFEQVNTVLAGYLRAQILSSLIVGLLLMIGFVVLKVPYPVLLGLAAGVLELVPVIGPAAGALLVVGLVRGGRLVAVLVLLATIRIVQDAVIYPRLMGRRVHLPPLAVLGAVWLGATLGGILGVLVAVPLVGVGAVASRQWRDYREIERLVREHAYRDRADRRTAGAGRPPASATARVDSAAPPAPGTTAAKSERRIANESGASPLDPTDGESL